MPDINDMKDILNQTAKLHLDWLETWTPMQPALCCGANLVQACVYDLIQIFNNTFLGAYLKELEATNA